MGDDKQKLEEQEEMAKAMTQGTREEMGRCLRFPSHAPTQASSRCA